MSEHKERKDSLSSEEDIDEIFRQELSKMREREILNLNGNGIGPTRSISLPANLLLSSMNGNAGHSSSNLPSLELSSVSQTTSPSVFSWVVDWSLNTYRCTRQMLAENLGFGTKTSNPEVQAMVVAVRDARRQYRRIARLATEMSNHFEKVLQTQKSLASVFMTMSIESPELTNEFAYNAETQYVLHKNGASLLAALKSFVSGINTLCNRTMIDALWTVRQLEAARLEYDANRLELETMLSSSSASSSFSTKMQSLHWKVHQCKLTYDNRKRDAEVKLKLLEDNKITVMHRQLETFHKAISAYFAGNQSDLETALKPFNIRLNSAGAMPSWLERHDSL